MTSWRCTSCFARSTLASSSVYTRFRHTSRASSRSVCSSSVYCRRRNRSWSTISSRLASIRNSRDLFAQEVTKTVMMYHVCVLQLLRIWNADILTLAPFYCRLRVAFKWLVRAFSGYLASEQVLMLWDRIIAFNSLEILPGIPNMLQMYQVDFIWVKNM